MRFMMLMIPTPENLAKYEAGAMPEPELVAAMMKYNEALSKAGVLLSLDGLAPPSAGARVVFSGGKGTVVDGPYTEAKEVIGGDWMIQVASKEDAVQWALRCPTGLGLDDVLDIRALTGEGDIPPNLLELVRKAAPTWSTTFSKKG